MQDNKFPTETLQEGHENDSNHPSRARLLSGLQNARDILHSLERSVGKARLYEERLMRCRAAHALPRAADREKENRMEPTKSRCPVNMAESWSTMSIVCLQYQYEELSKRYDALLQTYDACCGRLGARDAQLHGLQRAARDVSARLVRTHRALVAVGERYLAVRDKRNAEKQQYSEKVWCLQQTARGLLREAERARRELHAALGRGLAREGDAARAQLLAEIRKCNQLCLENIRLKAKIEEQHHEKCHDVASKTTV